MKAPHVLRSARHSRAWHALGIAVSFVLLLTVRPGPAADEKPGRLDRGACDRAVRRILADQGGTVRAGLWLGSASGNPWYDYEPGSTLPTASAIKTAFLIELFGRYAGALDAPPAGLDQVLRDDHPAIAHFSRVDRAEVRKALEGASVRRLGGVMMGSVTASNVVYNAAANAVTALLGGPGALTRSIHLRDPAFEPIRVRRYMLADRHVTGDNEATPAALAAVLQRLAGRRVPGLDTATVDDVRRAILTKDDPRLGRHFLKGGDLSSDPQTRVLTGWYETPGGERLVYVVMTVQPDPGGLPRDEAYRRLSVTAERLTETLVGAGRESLP